MTRSESTQTSSKSVQSAVMHKSELRSAQRSNNVPNLSDLKWEKVWWKKEQVLCACVRFMHAQEYSETPGFSQNCIWCDGWGCQFLKCMSGHISVWEASVWCGSDRLSATINLWQVTFFPSVLCFITMLRQSHDSRAVVTTHHRRKQHEMWS